MNLPPEIESKLLKLRRDFDETFAHVPQERLAAHQDLLGFRIGGDSYALRIGEISGFFSAGNVVPLPTSVPEIVGVAAVRGVLVPVLGVARLLGYARDADGARWLALADKVDPVALAFGEFEGYLRVQPSEAFLPDPAATAHKYIDAAVRAGERTRSILSVARMIAKLKGATVASKPARER